jgi:beta-phosphoglucomutase-like phosphatase (HAD superfamily)
MARDDVNFIFDLDGTLVDSVYQHVMAWQEALQAEHIDLSTWRIHRRIGMSGGLFTGMLLREVDVAISPALFDRLQTPRLQANLAELNKMYMHVIDLLSSVSWQNAARDSGWRIESWRLP